MRDPWGGGFKTLQPVVALVLLLAASALCPATARAATGIESVEWIVADSDLIVVGDYVGLHINEAEDRPNRYAVEIEVREIVLGPDSLQPLQRIYGSATAPYGVLGPMIGTGRNRVKLAITNELEWAAAKGHNYFGGPFIFFAVYGHRMTGIKPDASGNYPLVQRPYTDPVAFNCPVLRYRMDGHAMRSASEVLKCANVSCAGRAYGRPTTTTAVEIPWPGRHAFEQYMPPLLAPADDRLLALLHERSKTPADALFAMEVAAKHRTPMTESFVRGYLPDNTARPSGVSKLLRVQYPLREKAWQTLRNWGVVEPRPEVILPQDRYRSASTAIRVVAAAMVLLTAAFTFARRPRGEEWAARAWRVVLALLLVIAAALVVLERRGRRWADELTFVHGATRHWLTSVDGRVEWVRVSEWTARDPALPANAALGTFELGGLLDPLWRADPATVSHRWSRLTIAQTDGQVQGPAGIRRAYRRVSMPTWLAAVLVGLPPLMALARGAGRRIRGFARGRRGRCADCGYDLRGAEARCPECGGWLRPIRRPDAHSLRRGIQQESKLFTVHRGSKQRKQTAGQPEFR